MCLPEITHVIRWPPSSCASGCQGTVVICASLRESARTQGNIPSDRRFREKRVLSPHSPWLLEPTEGARRRGLSWERMPRNWGTQFGRLPAVLIKTLLWICRIIFKINNFLFPISFPFSWFLAISTCFHSPRGCCFIMLHGKQNSYLWAKYSLTGAVFSHKAGSLAAFEWGLRFPPGPKTNAYYLREYQRDHNKWESTLESEKLSVNARLLLLQYYYHGTASSQFLQGAVYRLAREKGTLLSSLQLIFLLRPAEFKVWSAKQTWR